METCEHIIGFKYDLWNESYYPVYAGKEQYNLGDGAEDFVFEFCPECGVKL